MIQAHRPAIWFVCGSQHLYGAGPLAQVRSNAERIAAALDSAPQLPLPVRFHALLTNADEVAATMREADADPDCAGLIVWMHTFSPAKMWIRGLDRLRTPLCHLHTQFARDLPWDEIDMDYMNLHQSAHGDREAGHLHSRMRLERKVVVGHWSDPAVLERLGSWARAAHAWHDLQGARFARFGDNMRQVAVTEGDKVGFELRFGATIDGFGVGDLVARVDAIADDAVDALVDEYTECYRVAEALRRGGERHEALRVGARIELGLRAFLEEGGYAGFTTTFEDLHGLRQLPGLAVQRLMADGYGFGAEGDWKTAVLLRAMKVMADGLDGGTSFMEDYTYHLDPDDPLVLGAHMLEVCPSIAAERPTLEIHPLGIGGREDPVRLVFDARPGEAINASLIDVGARFRLIVAEVEAVAPPPLPNLPVARALWRCKPDFASATAAWIYAGGAHHTVYSYALTREHLEDLAAIVGVELLVIGAETELRSFRAELRHNDLAYALSQGLRG